MLNIGNAALDATIASAIRAIDPRLEARPAAVGAPDVVLFSRTLQCTQLRRTPTPNNAEQQYREVVAEAKVRYVGVGLMFNKVYAYQRGGRPVVYEDTERAKDLLPEDEWWRIVRYNLTDEENIIDWTHERE